MENQPFQYFPEDSAHSPCRRWQTPTAPADSKLGLPPPGQGCSLSTCAMLAGAGGGRGLLTKQSGTGGPWDLCGSLMAGLWARRPGWWAPLSPRPHPPLPGSCPQRRGAAPGHPEPAASPGCAPHRPHPGGRHTRPGSMGDPKGTASGVLAWAAGRRFRLLRPTGPGPGPRRAARPGLPAARLAACGGWRPLQAAAGRTPGASAAGAAARRCQCHGVRRGARGRAGGRPPARPIPAARHPHAALTLERRRRIEELSRSSRQRLLQSRDRMFSKFTSILQHAVEAVRPPAGLATPRRGCEPGLAAERAPRGEAAGRRGGGGVGPAA